MKRFHDESDDRLRSDVADFLSAYNVARRPKMLPGPDALGIHGQALAVGAAEIKSPPVPLKPGTIHLIEMSLD